MGGERSERRQDYVPGLDALLRVVRLGSHLEQDERARRRLIINNGLSLALGLNVGIYSIVLFALGIDSLAWSLVPLSFGYLVPIWLSHHGRFALARFILVTLGATLSFGYIVAVGVRGEVSLFFAGVCLPLVVCGIHERALIAWGIALPMAFAAVIMIFGDAIMGPPLLAPNAEFVVRLILLIGTHAVLLAIVFSFVVSNGRAERRLEQQTAALHLLSTVASTANEAVSMDGALPRVLELVGRFSGFAVGHAWVLDKYGTAVGTSWYMREAERFHGFRSAYKALPLIQSAGILGRVVATRQWLWTATPQHDSTSPHAALAHAHGLLGCTAFPVVADDEVALVLEFYAEHNNPPSADLVSIVASVSAQLARVIERERNAATVHALALTDELTGLHNRRGFLAIASQQLRASTRHAEPSALIFADLDGLKRVNDTLGHKAGDGLIARFAALLVKTFRDADVCARLGGDEFVVFLTAPPEGVAIAVARLTQNVADHNAAHPEAAPVAVSLGIIQVPTDCTESVETLIARADAAMYENKRSRNSMPV